MTETINKAECSNAFNDVFAYFPITKTKKCPKYIPLRLITVKTVYNNHSDNYT